MIKKLFGLVYVFDTNTADGYLCRVPLPVARLITARLWRTSLDYWWTVEGMYPDMLTGATR